MELYSVKQTLTNQHQGFVEYRQTMANQRQGPLQCKQTGQSAARIPKV